MTPPAFLRKLFNACRPVTAAAVAEPQAPKERRRPAIRCTACNIWSPDLVYLSNGGHYCELCALTVHGWSRAKPAGKRFDDIPTVTERETWGTG